MNQYDPSYHTKPIVWFRSGLIRNLSLGPNEDFKSATPVRSFPLHSVIVRVKRGWVNKTNNIDKIGLVEIYFVGDAVVYSYATYPKIRRASIYASGDMTTNPNRELNCFEFGVSSSGADKKIEDVSEMLTYVNYIIKQLNTL